MSSRAFIGAGDLYINRIVGGIAQGWVGPYECSKFEIKPNVEKKEQKSKSKAGYGQVIETVNLAQPSDLTVEMPEVNKESLALALLGTTSAINQAAGDITNEAFTAKFDKWVPVSKAQISVVVLTNAAGTVTYTEGTDYLVNKELGWIKVLSTGTILDNASLLVDFHHALITGTLIKGATSTDVRAKFMLDGVNQADGLPVICTVHEGVIAADAAFDFLADDFNTVSLPGSMKTPSGFNEPFTVALRNAAAA
jgi:hypothetical protein